MTYRKLGVGRYKASFPVESVPHRRGRAVDDAWRRLLHIHLPDIYKFCRFYGYLDEPEGAAMSRSVFRNRETRYTHKIFGSLEGGFCDVHEGASLAGKTFHNRRKRTDALQYANGGVLKVGKAWSRISSTLDKSMDTAALLAEHEALAGQKWTFRCARVGYGLAL